MKVKVNKDLLAEFIADMITGIVCLGVFWGFAVALDSVASLF